MKENKIYEYKGFKIRNSPYGSEPRWFIFNGDMSQFRNYPEKTLKACKKIVDNYWENFEKM